MEDATNAMVTPYDPSKPTTKLFVQIEMVLQIADSANTSFTNAKITAKAYVFV